MSANESSPRKQIPALLISLFLIAATVAVFWQVKSHGFVNYDDDTYVTQSPHVQAGLTLAGAKWAFTSGTIGMWHPLTWLSLMLDSQLYGPNPGGFHLTNLFFHIANALLLFLVLFKMTGARLRSGFVAALFALHPLHVESVAWVSERKDVLSTFFWLLTMWAYALYVKERARESCRRWYGITFVFFILGLLSKPMLVTLPFVLLLLDYWPLCRIQNDPQLPVSRLVLEKIPFFALAAAASVLTFLADHTAGAVKSAESLSPWARIPNALVSYASYIVKMLWPRNLSAFYPYPKSLPLWEVTASALLIAGVSTLVIRLAKTKPWLAMGWFWYLGTLIPVIGLVKFGSSPAMADRYTYMPLVGLWIMLAWSVPRRCYGSALSVATGLLLSGLMVISWRQTRYWRNSVTLFEHALAVTTNNALAENNLGVVFAAQGKTQQAIERYSAAIKIDPHYADAYNNLGHALASQGKTREAIEQYSAALRLNPREAVAHDNLGVALVGQGKTQEGIRHFVEALKINPEFAEAHNNFGVALADQGKIQQAIEQYSAALKIESNYPDAQDNLGIALAAQGKTREAIERYSAALKIDPDFAEAHSNLGIALASQGKFQQAVEQYSAALKIEPSSAKAQNELGVALLDQGETEQAIGHLLEAIRIDPGFAEAQSNLGVALGVQGKTREAIGHFVEALGIKPNFAGARVNLGIAYLKIGNKRAALKEYKALEKLDPRLAKSLYRKIYK